METYREKRITKYLDKHFVKLTKHEDVICPTYRIGELNNGYVLYVDNISTHFTIYLCCVHNYHFVMRITRLKDLKRLLKLYKNKENGLCIE